MRILLFTGKGGVGKTSIAAATAMQAAAAGRRTLVVSTDPAHSLADALDRPLRHGPEQVMNLLWAEQIDARERLEASWRQIQEYLVHLLQWGGATEIEAEELSVVPGLEEIFSLIDVRRRAESGDYDVLAVDCAPTAETLRLLSLPDVLGWYLERVFPTHRRLATALRPVLGRVTTMPLPQDGLLAAVEELQHHLRAARGLLTDGSQTTVRLVLNPERVVIAEAQRMFTYLSLFDYHVDAVIVNRLLPDRITDPYLTGWKARQREHLETIAASFGALPLLQAPLLPAEPVGEAGLRALGEALYGAQAVDAIMHRGAGLGVRRVQAGYILSVPLPLADRGDIDLWRRGDELFVKVGPHSRALDLPAVLRRGEVAGARVNGDHLEVRFTEGSAGEPLAEAVAP